MDKINKLNNKKGVELTLNMIIILIICVIVLIVMIYFFSSNYLDGTNQITNISTGVLGEYN